MQKSEGGKVRPVVIGVVSGGERIVQEDGLPLGGGYETPTVLKIPLDQSAFDNNHSVSSILTVLLASKDTIIDGVTTPE